MLKKTILFTFYFLLSACTTPSAVEIKNSNSAVASINTQLALAYLDQNDPARGKEKLLLAQKQAPSDPSVWYVSGYFLERTGDILAAESSYLHAIQLAPHLGEAQNNYGAFLCRQKKYTTAITYFLSAANNPSYLNVAKAYENAAQCALKIPNKSLAATYFELAAERSGNAPMFSQN